MFAGLISAVVDAPAFAIDGDGPADPPGSFQVAQEPTPPRRTVQQRPPAAGQPGAQGPQADSLRPREGAVAQEPIDINFEDAALLEIIQMIGAQTGRNFEVDPSLGNQRVTIISHHPVPPDLAYEVLESVLATRNFAMVETLNGNLVKIVPRGQNVEKLALQGPDDPLEGFDNFALYIVPVEHAAAADVANVLQAVGSKDAKITVYDLTNTLIISDTADGLRNMLQLLDMIDVAGYDTQLEIFVLEYARAEDLVNKILDVLTESAGQPGQPGQRVVPPTRITRTARPAVPGQQEPEIFGEAESVLRMVPDERLNAIIVIATEGQMEQVRFLIDQLDTPIPIEQNNMHYKPLNNADAEQVEEVLNAITGGTPRLAEGAAAGGAPQAGAEVQPFEKEIIITRYEPTNALVIVASPQDFRILEMIIEQLDVPRRQVNVESMILEVTINDQFQLSVETLGIGGEDIFALNNVVDIANAIASGPLGLAGPGTTVGIIDGTTEIPVPTGVDPDTGTPTGIALQSIPNIPLLMRALETITDVEVLSKPNLLTVDTETSDITVGQEIPIITSLSDTNDRTGFLSRSRVEREDVGVKMEVTPQINEGDYVALELSVEVSQPVPSSVGIDPNIAGPTFNKSLITSNVIVGDGQTGIIGGLIREGVDKTVSQAPLLGDIPVLGFLFRRKNNSRSKQNLVILVTPNIIKERHDLTHITDYRIDEFYYRNVDVIFEDLGYIQKIRKKQYLRNDYRPTDILSPDADPWRDRTETGRPAPRQGFRRGDIDRGSR
ncbi:MAG: type II secretion system secretin GspD [Candidatus Hydrogenedentales bacterium]